MDKKMLAVTAAITLAGMGLFGTAVSQPNWLGIEHGSVEVTPLNPQVTRLALTANDTVPMETGALAGFAWFYSSGDDTAFAITTHEADLDGDGRNDVRDSTQNPDNWHAHNVLLGDGTGSKSSDFCIERISDAPFANVALADGGNVIVNSRNSTHTGTFNEPVTAAAFEIVVDGNCDITEPTKKVVQGGLPLAVNVTNTAT